MVTVPVCVSVCSLSHVSMLSCVKPVVLVYLLSSPRSPQPPDQNIFASEMSLLWGTPPAGQGQ
jgi:hypothetical protein